MAPISVKCSNCYSTIPLIQDSNSFSFISFSAFNTFSDFSSFLTSFWLSFCKFSIEYSHLYVLLLWSWSCTQPIVSKKWLVRSFKERDKHCFLVSYFEYSLPPKVRLYGIFRWSAFLLEWRLVPLPRAMLLWCQARVKVSDYVLSHWGYMLGGPWMACKGCSCPDNSGNHEEETGFLIWRSRYFYLSVRRSCFGSDKGPK